MQLGQLGPQVAPTRNLGVERGSLTVVERPDGGQRDQLAQFQIPVLAHIAPPIAPRRRSNPSRILVFTVPNATPSRSAISTWVRPS